MENKEENKEMGPVVRVLCESCLESLSSSYPWNMVLVTYNIHAEALRIIHEEEYPDHKVIITIKEEKTSRFK